MAHLVSDEAYSSSRYLHRAHKQNRHSFITSFSSVCLITLSRGYLLSFPFQLRLTAQVDSHKFPRRANNM